MFTRTRCLVAGALIWALTHAALGDATWTGASSTQWDLAANWAVGLPSGNTAQAAIEGYGTSPPGAGWPVIDSTINTAWGILRARGPGLHLTQTGGTHEWQNGSGISSRGMTIQSRPPQFPTDAGPSNPGIITLTGGTMITDAVGVGTPGGLNSGSFYAFGGDYTLDTGMYRVWQTNPGDDRYGWGRLEIGGTATLIVRPNRFIFPSGYSETTPYWTVGGWSVDKPYRNYDIAIGPNSKIVLSGGGRLIAPLAKFVTNPDPALRDRDVLAQCKYYAGLVPAGSPPHFVPQNRFVAGDGEVLVFTLYPATDTVGGYFIVTATPGTAPAWFVGASPEAVQTATAIEGSSGVDPNSTIVPYLVGNSDFASAHTINISEVDEFGAATNYDWLSLGASSVNLAARAATAVSVTIDHLTPSMPAGVHTAYVKFTDSVDPSKTETRQIQLTVLGCQWAVTPGSGGFDRYYISGSGDPPGSVVLTVDNTGKNGLTYTVAKVPDDSTTAWLDLGGKTGGGPLDYAATDLVTAAVNPAGLAVGDYSCIVRLTSGCSPADSVEYTVALHILPSGYADSGDGLLAQYRFEDSLRDWTGHGYTGTVAGGAPSYVESNNGRGIHFHGSASGDGVNLGGVPSPSDTGGSKAMSMVLWYRSEDMPEDTWLIAKSQATGSPAYWKGWHIKLANTGGAPTISYIWCHDGLRETLTASTPARLFDGNWHQIALTIEDNNTQASGHVDVRGYYDGQLLGEALDRAFEPAPAALAVYLSVSYQTPTLGDVDDLSLWNRALSSDEILAMYQGTYSFRPWPDADEDGDVDHADFAMVQQCYTGIDGTASQPCERFNRNPGEDDDVDETDLDAFESCATGPGIPLDWGNPPSGCN